MKKKSVILAIFILLLVSLGMFFLFIKQQKNTDAFKFKQEYESLNGTIRKKDGKTIRTITIDKENPFIYKEASQVVEMIDNKESFVVYFGFADCPWCRSVLPTLIEVAKDLDLETIYYVDVKEIRDEMILDADAKVITEKKGDKGYYELLTRLDSVLEEYTLYDEKNNKISTGEKRIYAPTVVGVVNGKVEKATDGISEKQTDGYMELTEEMKEDTYNKFKCVLKCVIDKSKTCSVDKGC